MPKYKASGLFSKSVTYRRWIIVTNGEEQPIHKKSLALFLTRNSKRTFPDIQLIEETKIRTVQGIEVKEMVFRVDISNQIEP